MRDKIVLDAFLKAIKIFNESAPTLLLSEVVLTYMAVNRLTVTNKKFSIEGWLSLQGMNYS